MKLLNKLKVEVLVNPESVEEIAKDPVTERKEIRISTTFKNPFNYRAVL